MSEIVGRVGEEEVIVVVVVAVELRRVASFKGRRVLKEQIMGGRVGVGVEEEVVGGIVERGSRVGEFFIAERKRIARVVEIIVEKRIVRVVQTVLVKKACSRLKMKGGG